MLLYKYCTGCQGGFTYLIGGKYSEDFGMVEEACNLYVGRENKTCTTNPSCQRFYFTKYEYVGGYFGAYVLMSFTAL